MTEVFEVATPEPTVEDVVGQILGELGGALGMLVSSLGVRTGMWAALSGAGPLTSADLADSSGVAEPLAREWLRAQAAAGYLRYEPATGRFELPDAVATAILLGPGAGLLESSVEMITALGSGFPDFVEAFGSGDGFGWDQQSERFWHGSDVLTQTALPPALIATMLDCLGTNLHSGGAIADIGSGFGSPTLAVASHFPAARVLGVDYNAASVAHATKAAANAGLSDRLRFEVAAATDLPGSEYDLITFFDSLHDFGDPVGALRHAREAMAPNGVVMVVEVLGADRVEDNLHPTGRLFYAVSTMICTPNAVSQQFSGTHEPLGTLAGESMLREVASEAGFTRVERLAVDAPMNLVLKLQA